MQLKFGQRLAEVSGLSLGKRKYFLFTLKINFRLSKLFQSSTSLINGNFSITIQPLGRLWADKNTPRSLPVSDAEEEEEVRAQYGGELGQGRRKSLDIESCQTTREELNTSLKKLFINLSVPWCCSCRIVVINLKTFRVLWWFVCSRYTACRALLGQVR